MAFLRIRWTAKRFFAFRRRRKEKRDKDEAHGNDALERRQMDGDRLATLVSVWSAAAQTISTTTVQGTVYLANGKPSSGTLQLSWPAFATSNSLAVAAGSMSLTIGADGFVSVNLTPNLGASPAGLFYTAVYHMTDGTMSTEF